MFWVSWGLVSGWWHYALKDLLKDWAAQATSLVQMAKYLKLVSVVLKIRPLNILFLLSGTEKSRNWMSQSHLCLFKLHLCLKINHWFTLKYHIFELSIFPLFFISFFLVLPLIFHTKSYDLLWREWSISN